MSHNTRAHNTCAQSSHHQRPTHASNPVHAARAPLCCCSCPLQPCQLVNLGRVNCVDKLGGYLLYRFCAVFCTHLRTRACTDTAPQEPHVQNLSSFIWKRDTILSLSPGVIPTALPTLPPPPPATSEGQALRPRYPLDRSFLLEVDPETYAVGSGVSRPAHVGKWLGVLDRAGAIVATGATAVVLPCPMLRGEGLGVQGRANASYFAPDGRYAVASSPQAAAEEFGQLVKGLHARGLEVLIQIEFCFTAEGDDKKARLISFRGLDSDLYYRPSGLLKLSARPVRSLVVDALHHWLQAYHVDGFVLLSAEAMVQDSMGRVQDAPALAADLAADGELRGIKVIAWPRDYALLPRSGRRGFPHSGTLLQHNGRFGAVLQWLATGGPGLLTKVASQLTGNADMLQADWSPEASLPGNLAAGRRPAFGINTISSPIVDGTTLWSWVDSIADPVDIALTKKRLTLAKSAVMLMMLSPGTPQASAVDFSNSEIAGFFRGACAARFDDEIAELLRPSKFEVIRDVKWFDAHGGQPKWDFAGYDDTVLGYCAREGGALGKAVCLVVNAGETQVRVAIPQPPGGSLWQLLLNSGATSPDDVLIHSGGLRLPAGGGVALEPKAVALLCAFPSKSRSLPSTVGASPVAPV
eukprot:jgi/Ulvmu1/6569/UM003_0206.1